MSLEALALSFETLGMKILRIPQSNSVSINGNKASPIFYVWISNKAETAVPPRKKLRLNGRYVNNETPAVSMSNLDLAAATHDLADAMRAFEANKRKACRGKAAREWSYRFVFETYRRRALALRSELWRRLNSQPAVTFALDADYLGGPTPITDAANYLDDLAKQLRDAASASPVLTIPSKPS